MSLPGPKPVQRFFKTTILKQPLVIFGALAVLSAPLRLFHLQEPLTGEHEIRQTQTALSVWEIREHGFSLLHPKLPLFGPPWECPLEYPVFQSAAAAVDCIAPWSNLDVSIRVTNVAFYYLTAVALYLLAQLILAETEALFTAAIFLFSAYNAFWSRTAMIEYAATFFGLAYLVSFIRWTLKPTRTLFVLSLCFGTLGCLTKVTSFVIPLFAAGILAGLHVLRLIRPQHPTADALIRTAGRDTRESDVIPPESQHTAFRPVHILGLAVLLLVPLLVGYLYIGYSDAVKEQTPYTAWLSSRHPYIKAWNYGTWAQRLRMHNWEILLGRIQHINMPSLAFAMVIGFCALPFRARPFGRLPGGNFWAGCGLALAPFLGILIFYNLYLVHTYYLIACSPFLALFAGVGLGLVFKLVPGRLIRLLFLLLLIGLGLQEWSRQLGAMLGFPPTMDRRVTCLVEAARRIKKEEPVIVLSSAEWSAFAPYYLKRRAFMARLFNKPVNIQPLLDQQCFKKNGFHWLLIEGKASGMPELTAQITNRWKIVRAVPLSDTKGPYTLYSLSDE